MNEKIKSEVVNQGDLSSLDRMRAEFFQMLKFVKAVSPNGFTKSVTGNQVPRVRFESIAVGASLALRADPSVANRVGDISQLLNSKEFAAATTSDAANVKSKLLRRITLVRNWLLK